MKLRTKTWLAVTAATGLALGGFSPALAAGNAGPTEHTDMGVTGDAVMDHLQKISDISTSHSDEGFRALGTPGYEESVEYVEETLEATGAFDVERQAFDVDDQTFGEVAVSVDGEELEVTPASYTEGTEEPLTDLSVALPVDDDFSDLAGGQLGCEASDFDDSAEGALVLVARGSCAFGEKTQAATDAGAAAVILYNNDTSAPDEALNATLGERVENGAPTVGVSYNEGNDLLTKIEGAAEGEPLLADFTLETEYTTSTTWNVIAETKAGDHDNVQMFGAHLDGVAVGPGANDNGSGSAALLASAEALAKQPTEADNAIRFGWWAAEEVGLVGSTHYVESLSESEASKVKSYMNFDMIGSDNYIVGTLDSDGSDVPIPDGVNVPEGSAELEKVFTDYFDTKDQPNVGTDFSGRSDYQAFIDNGIPSSGLFSGADGTKTQEEADMFGGTVGDKHDTNYHQPTDTIENVSQESLDIFSPAIAYAVHTLAYDLRDAPAPTDPPSTPPTDPPTETPTETPTDDPTDAPVERSLSIDPTTIDQADFIGAKGVQVAAAGCTPDTTATMTVEPQNGTIETFEQTATADADSVARFGVRGLDESKAATYVGTYEVTVDCDGGEPLSGSFEVLAADSDGPGAGDGGGDLPRTGNEALPLVISAGALMVLGVIMTMGARRRKA
ncbi:MULTISPECIES: M20/M25/M40 family metallo-hydrolase [Brevibacterium]|uniref:PA domain-containing protein n=1 Tax=Brevibacterium antiquum CNRZ 918 TaxID=1255637 RepID=A0A2H1KKC0_9MICO|nr:MULTISPECIES: M20/M25/M40 family metallo-hydrolase [Brevibacterium]SMY00240.1 PA domain-containing protein [Brevibacterium antiquum CNRZ 918]HCG55951.1 hydrolase [Brevibacterium sp.]